MAVFAYRARNPQGAEVRGVLSADTHASALADLDSKGLLPLDLREASASAVGGRRVGLSALSQFYGQLAALLQAGVPILRSLDVLSRQKGSPALKLVLDQLRDDVASGEPLNVGMAKHPAAFPALHVAMVAAGERGGFLEESLSNLAGFVERQDDLRSRVVGALIYPAILLLVGAIVFLAAMVWFVPLFQPILERKADLPSYTRAMFVASAVLREWWGALLLMLALVVAGVAAYAQSETGQRQLDALSIRLPVAGRLIVLISFCRFCRVLGTLLRNGIPILQALKIAEESAGNRVVAERIAAAAENVRKGEPLGVPLGAGALFPQALLDMISVGEESNRLDKVLVDIADAQEARTARQVDVAVRLIEPLMLIFIALMVMGFALAMLVPVLTSSSMSG